MQLSDPKTCLLVLTVREFCAHYNVGRTYAFEEMSAGRLEYFYYGAHRRIAVDDAERWLAKKQKAAKFLRELGDFQVPTTSCSPVEMATRNAEDLTREKVTANAHSVRANATALPTKIKVNATELDHCEGEEK